MSNQRINRRTFVAALVASFIPFLVIAAVSNTANSNKGTAQNILYTVFGILLLISALYFLVTAIALTIKRLHDVGWPWVLVILFGLFTPFLIVIALIPGQEAHNKYGAVPAKKFDLRSALMWWSS